jgi:hypothetical protein
MHALTTMLKIWQTVEVVIHHSWSPVSDENIFRLPRPGSTTCLLCHVRATAARGAAVLAMVLLLVGLLTADALTLRVLMAITWATVSV